MIHCISISSWCESSGAAAAQFLSTNKTSVNLRGDQKLVVLGFFYRLVRFLMGASDRLSNHGFGGDMGSPKDEVSALLKKLPDDASFEDIQYHLYVLEKVKRGLERAQSEGAIPHQEAKARLGRWLAS